jgi:protease-4
MSEKGPIVRFFGFIWRVIERLTKVLQVLIFLFVIVLLFSALSNMSGQGIKIPESAALLIAPTGLLQEQAGGDPLDQALLELQNGDIQTIVREVIDSLRAAADDERIKAVVLLPGNLQGGGLSKHQAIGDALVEFRASGKPVLAMADGYSQEQYYLAAHADEVYMHDFGLVLIEGFGYFKTYFADAIEKLKIDMNVFRVGEYKSFVEPFLRNDMSREDKEVSRKWLEALWLAYKEDVTEARGIVPDDFDHYVNNLAEVLEGANGDAGQAAIDMGLVDGLMTHQQFRDYVIDIVGANEDEPDTFERIDYRTYLTATGMAGEETGSNGGNVAVIIASGAIVDGEATPGTIGSATMARLIRQAANDENIAAVVLRVDSPGGSMFASEILVDQLQVLKERGKPLVASMGSVAASGGYYISMVADEIWAAETTISGSIGVGATYPTFQRSLDAIGVHVDGFGTTPLTGELSQVRELGEDARKLLDVSVKSAYDVFIDKVAESREMDRSRIEGIAQGRVWIGDDAFEIGLVDQIGGIDEAIASAADMAGLEAGAYDVSYIERELSVAEQILLQYARLFGLLFSFEDTGLGGLSDSMRKLLHSLDQELQVLDSWNDPRGIYYHCLCEIR